MMNMNKIKLIISILCVVPLIGYTQYGKLSDKKPNLVIGIVVDQMRYDYIHRFWDDFGDRGFK